MKDTDSAFPYMYLNTEMERGKYRDVVYHGKGMTLKQYAAIHLRVPRSGDPEIDAMIRASRRMDIAQMLLPKFADYTWETTNPVRRSLEFADALLAEWEKEE